MIDRNKMFIKPTYNFEIDNFYVNKNFRTYSEYNYLNYGIGADLKRMHFEKALELTKDHFNKANVIDFGCADGVLLPSLSRYFNNVVGVDINPQSIETSKKLVSNMKLDNVNVFCNKNMEINELKSIITDNYDIIFLLEVLEHIGEKNKMYKSRINFLNDIFSLINKEGKIVISVPNMVGLSFLFQRIGLTIFRMHKEELSWKQLLKSSIINNTDELEKKWQGGHLGFNHKKLERYMEKEFNIVQNKNLIFQTVYIICR